MGFKETREIMGAMTVALLAQNFLQGMSDKQWTMIQELLEITGVITDIPG